MSDFPETAPIEWDLGEWERALTINVGTAYACEVCGNLAMVTRGGIGVMELTCCGKRMKQVEKGRDVAGGTRT